MPIHYERDDDHIVRITIDRPEARNSADMEHFKQLRMAWERFDEDAEAWVAIITGVGDAFFTGADLKTYVPEITQVAERIQKEGLSEVDGYRLDDGTKSVLRGAKIWKPIIAAVNGPCAGLGMVIALYADVRFASETAVFMTAFSRRGLIAEHGISWLLPRLVGLAIAADLLFSARRVAAAEALAIRLVNRVFPAERFEADVLAYAKMLASEVSPRSLREMKREIWNAQFQTLGEAIEAADKDMAASFASEDFKEGVAHFVEKRAPAFSGK